MVSREIPAYTYAVFAHIGALDKLSDTYQYIYQVWLPQSGYKMAAYVDFEYYNEDFKDFAPDSRLYIYVPIEKVS
jgi:AraC family transcriptional regulator